MGSKIGALDGNYRARQNAVFEHDYLIGKLGCSRVTAVVKGTVDTPNDISTVVYVALDEQCRGQAIKCGVRLTKNMK